MLVVLVVEMPFDRIINLLRGDLAVRARQRQDLVPAVLDGAGLVDIDMARLGAEHSLVGLQHRSYDGGVGLRAADQEMDIYVLPAAGAADEPARLGAVLILAVADGLYHICVLKALHDPGESALAIIACKKCFHSTLARFILFRFQKKRLRNNRDG